jgi:hypothetical protein
MNPVNEFRLYEEYIIQAIEGVYRWKNDTPAIQGVTPQIIIKIFDKNNNEFTPIWNSPGLLYASPVLVANFAADSKRQATVYVEENYRGSFTTMVPDLILGWKKTKRLQIHVRNEGQGARRGTFDRLIEHEFGHVLGLFDAYGYGKHIPVLGNIILPKANEDSVHVKYDSVMLCDWDRAPRTFVRTATDLAMILYAWQENKLQCYINSAKGHQSQAYYH